MGIESRTEANFLALFLPSGVSLGSELFSIVSFSACLSQIMVVRSFWSEQPNTKRTEIKKKNLAIIFLLKRRPDLS